MLLRRWSGQAWPSDFFGGKHTWLNTGQGIYEELEPLLAASPHVRMHAWSLVMSSSSATHLYVALE
jgi:hypothetical protein